VSHARGGSHILRVLDPSIASSPVGRLLCPRIRIIGVSQSKAQQSAILTRFRYSNLSEVARQPS